MYRIYTDRIEKKTENCAIFLLTCFNIYPKVSRVMIISAGSNVKVCSCCPMLYSYQIKAI